MVRDGNRRINSGVVEFPRTGFPSIVVDWRRLRMARQTLVYFGDRRGSMDILGRIF